MILNDTAANVRNKILNEVSPDEQERYNTVGDHEITERIKQEFDKEITNIANDKDISRHVELITKEIKDEF
jgi:hypothetical protein